MRKLVVVVVLFVFTLGYSQENVNFSKNELKANAVFLLAGAFEGTYERILNEESGVGVSFFVPISNHYDTKFSVTPTIVFT